MSNKNNKTKVLILGSGPAGMTAAIYAARADLAPIVIAGKEPGGQLTTTTSIENFPGFPDGIPGPQLMQDMIKQAEKFGATMVYANATKANLSKSPFSITVEDSTEYESDTVILATGASARWLGVPGEEKLKSKGIHTCATCDGYFYKDKELFVVGGGDSAMEEANFLTKFAKKVTLLVRKSESEPLKASPIMIERSKKNPKIEWRYNSEIAEFIGEDKLTAVKLNNNATGEISEEPIDGVFLAIGHEPNTHFFKEFITTTKNGYIDAELAPITNIDGVFVAGDVNDSKYRQAITAAGAGCKAAMEARWWLAEKGDAPITAGY